MNISLQRRGILAVCIILVLAGGHRLFAAISISNTATTLTATYAINTAVTTITDSATISNTSSTGTKYLVAFFGPTWVNMPSSLQSGYSFKVRAGAGSTDSTTLLLPAGTTTVTSAQVLTSTVSQTSPDSYSISFTFAATTTVPTSGTYTATITESLYSYTGSNYTNLNNDTLISSTTLTIQITVPPFLDVSVLTTNGPFDVNTTSQSLSLGTLSPAGGQTANCYILARTNASSYSISLSSLHNGSLFHSSGSSYGSVPYTLTSNGGSSFSLGSTYAIPGGTGTYASPASYRIVVTTSSFTNNPAYGSYSDTITVTLSSP